MSANLRTTLEAFGLFVVSLILFTWGLSAEEIVGFESRFYLFAQEMLRSGFVWFPTTYHQPYPDYPVTGTALIYFSATLFGGLNKFTAVFPSAVAAALTTALTYAIGALKSKRWGVAAVAALFLTATFIHDARSIALDMYPTLITACCFYLIYSADELKKPARIWWVFPLLVLSFGFRGPIGIVIPAGMMCIYYLINHEFKRLFIMGMLALIILSACTLAILALAHHIGGAAFMHDVLRMQIMGRISGASYRPLHFYFTNGMGAYAISFPLALLVMLGAGYYYFIARVTIQDLKFLVTLFGWMVVIVVGMSVPGDKKIRYILPMIPAAALITAYPFVIIPREKYFEVMRALLTTLFLSLPILLVLMIAGLYTYTNRYEINFGIFYLPLIVFLIAMQATNIWIFYRRDVLWEVKLLAIAAMSFFVTYASVIEPMQIYMDRARDFVNAVEKLRAQANAHLVFYREQPDGLPIKYLINMPKEEQPEFILTPKQLDAYSAPAFFITSVSYFDALPDSSLAKFEIIAADQLGHKQVIVFKRKRA